LPKSLSQNRKQIDLPDVVGSDLLDVVTVPVGAAGVDGGFRGTVKSDKFFRGSVTVPYKIKDQL